MALPTIVVRDREIVLLSGFDRAQPDLTKADPTPKIRDEEKLRQYAARHRDAVAFGYVAGKWFAAA
jgi:hypothetical protein